MRRNGCTTNDARCDLAGFSQTSVRAYLSSSLADPTWGSDQPALTIAEKGRVLPILPAALWSLPRIFMPHRNTCGRTLESACDSGREGAR